MIREVDGYIRLINIEGAREQSNHRQARLNVYVFEICQCKAYKCIMPSFHGGDYLDQNLLNFWPNQTKPNFVTSLSPSK